MKACSTMAENLIGSEIIKLAGIIQEKINKGEQIFNFTIGDFDPNIYPIPSTLKEYIQLAYQQNQTNYPPAAGLKNLRSSIRQFIIDQQGLDYSVDEYLVSGGARPLIYALYHALLDPGDKVIYPVPSWNNNHYCHLSTSTGIEIPTKPENNFMPTAEELRPYINQARLISLCSPLNPTGTTFNREELEGICTLVLEENQRRVGKERPLYLLYDQIYHVLCFGQTKHYDPVSLNPAMRPYTIYIDGLSKAFAATGIRVGWAFGPEIIIAKMRAILSHVGAWAPKPEQCATSDFLSTPSNFTDYLHDFKNKLAEVLEILYNGFVRLNKLGYKVEAIPPQAGLYLTIKLDLTGQKTQNGELLSNQKEVWEYILNESKIALVPFSAFGDSADSPWYRLSIGTCTSEIAVKAIDSLEGALRKLR
jgi:aspartate aminotransferase